MGSFSHVAIQDVADYWNARPCNIRHSPRPVGTREYFDEVEARKYFVEPHIPGFARFEQWAGRRVLEVGCGIGTDTIRFARAGAHVTAVDLSEKSLDVARQRAAVFGLEDRIRFHHGSAEQLDDVLPAGTYDLIYSFGVIHHTPNPDRVLAQLRPRTHADTVFKLMLYHRYATKVLRVLLTEGRGQYWKLPEIVARHSEAQTGCPVTYTYTRRSASDWLRRHRFRPVEVRVDHIFPYRVTDYLNYQYAKPWYYAVLPQPLFRALERTLGWHLCITAKPA